MALSIFMEVVNLGENQVLHLAGCKQKVNTWANLCNRGWSGPNRCCLCNSHAKTVDHLLVGCAFTLDVIHCLRHIFDVHLVWSDTSLVDNLSSWIKRKGRLLYLPFFFIWNLWKTKNCLIFENIIPNTLGFYFRIMSEVDSYLVRLSNKPNVRLIGDPPECIFPMVFFDGVAAEQVGGVGACIWISEHHFLSIKLGCGHSTNTRDEMLALWASLYIAKDIGLPYLHVFDDSSVIINWAKK